MFRCIWIARCGVIRGGVLFKNFDLFGAVNGLGWRVIFAFRITMASWLGSLGRLIPGSQENRDASPDVAKRIEPPKGTPNRDGGRDNGPRVRPRLESDEWGEESVHGHENEDENEAAQTDEESLRGSDD